MPIVVEGASVTAAGDGAGGGGVGGRTTLLADLSFVLREAEITVVVGRSGAGKSTLLELLAGLREPQAGIVRYGDTPLWQGRRVNPDMNRTIGFVCQQPEQHLFAASVRREFRYSLRHLRLPKSEAAARVRAALQTVQLPQEVLERSPFTLSVGQQRRVALATVIATEPGWLFLDEPTAGLDPEGVAQLTVWLRRWKERSGGGIVIATHDLDALLPLADRVLVLDGGGTIAADMTPQQLCAQPHVLPALGVGWPGYVELAALLGAAGLPVAADSSADAMAAAISRLLSGEEEAASGEAAAEATVAAVDAAACPVAGYVAVGTHTAVAAGAAAALDSAARRLAAVAEPANAATLPAPGLPAAAADGRAVRAPAWSWVLALDPRAKWLFLGLVSAAILLQNRWSGIACAAAAVLAVAACCRYPLRRFWPVLRTYAVFVALSAALSGLQLGGGSGGLVYGMRFSVPHSLATVQPLVRLVPVMVLGLLFGRTTSYNQVKRGLEQSLAPLRRWRSHVEALTFTAAMMFRLIPLLTQLFERLSRIARTRGKSRAKPGTLALRDVPVVLVPFLLSAFQLAEQLSLAAEAKGFRIGRPRTSAVHLRFQRSDMWTVAAGGGIFVVLWMLRG